MKTFLKSLIFILLSMEFTAVSAQNIQVHYDFGRALYSEFNKQDAQRRPTITTTVEMFKPDRWGSTFFFIDMDYSSKGMDMAYWEIARELRFWKIPVSLHVEYNGGLNHINHAFLGGATYTHNSSDYNKGVSASILYKYIKGNDSPNNFQLTGTWFIHFLKGKMTFNGFADFWREKHTDINGGKHSYVFMTEPQLWVNLNRFSRINDNFNLSFGTELEITDNFALKNGIYAIPTLAAKWSF